LKWGRTVIVIAHRLKTIKNAGHIVVMEEGSVAEEGTQEALLKKGGLYHKLRRIQTQSFGWEI